MSVTTSPLMQVPPTIADPQLRTLLEQIREKLETRDGVRGDPMKRGIELGDMVSLGLVKVEDIASLRAGPALTLPLSKPNFSTLSVAGQLNRAIPPKPQNLVVHAGIERNLLEWDAATYSNHSTTEIWRSVDDNQSNAVKVGEVVHNLYPDAVDPGSTWYYWIRFVSQAGVSGPFNDVAGVQANASFDPQVLLNTLEGKIAEAQLATGLTDRIELIDGDANVAGSVDARIAQEAQTRSSADQAVAESVNQLSTTVGENTAAIEQHAQTIDGIQASWTIKTDVNGLVSGVSLMNDGTASAFQILASNFAVLDPADPTKVVIGTDNGAVVIEAAYLKNLVVKNQDVENLDVGKLVGDKAAFVSANITTLTGKRIKSADGLFDIDMQNKTFVMKSATTGGRVERTADRTRVYDDNGVCRVKIGRL